MQKFEKKSILFALMAIAIAAAASVCYVRLTGNTGHIPLVLIADIFLSLLITMAAMAVSLRKMMKITLYSYTNIGLVGGLIFAAVLAISALAWFIACAGAEELSLKYVYSSVVRFPRQFSLYAGIVILAVSVLVGISNVALIRHEGFCLNNALSLIVAGFYIGGTVLIYVISDVLLKKVFVPRGVIYDRLFIVLDTVIPLFLLLVLSYFECILAGSAVMGLIAARRVPAYDKDYIIILGCSIDKRGGLLPLLKGRVNRAIRFAWEQEIAAGKPAKYVPSGGQGANEVMSEGSAMELYLLTRGAESYEVFPEKKSASTWENMCFSKKIIDELQPGARVAFATTNYHILRSGILARKAGLDAEGIAGDTKWYFWPNGFVREFFAILALNVKAHILVIAVIAVLCTAMGFAGYFV